MSAVRDRESKASTLRAMAANYAGGHRWDHLDGEAVTAAAAEIEELRAAVEQQGETGWLIERHQNSRLQYFDGKPRAGVYGKDFDYAWTDDVHSAIRFAREQDAAGVLAWCLGGIGRVAEHRWG